MKMSRWTSYLKRFHSALDGDDPMASFFPKKIYVHVYTQYIQYTCIYCVSILYV